MNMWSLLNDDTVCPLQWSEVILNLSDYGACPYYVVYRKRSSLSNQELSSFFPSYINQVPSFNDYDLDCLKKVITFTVFKSVGRE